LRPAETASRMAWAMSTGSVAEAMPVFMSTPAQPSSIATAASDAVPTPASTITGALTFSMMRRMLCGLRMPSPEPIGAASGMTARHPASTRRLQVTRSSPQ